MIIALILENTKGFKKKKKKHPSETFTFDAADDPAGFLQLQSELEGNRERRLKLDLQVSAGFDSLALISSLQKFETLS